MVKRKLKAKSAPSEKGKGKQSVNSGVDTLLALMPFYGFEGRPRDVHKIKLLQINDRCKIRDILVGWGATRPNEYESVLAKLKLIAGQKDLPRLATVKRVGSQRKIIQISAGGIRLFCFEDQDGLNIACVHAFEIGSGNKTAEQNNAIKAAEALRERWLRAEEFKTRRDENQQEIIIRIEREGR